MKQLCKRQFTLARLCAVILLILCSSSLAVPAASAQGGQLMLKVLAPDFIVVRGGASQDTPVIGQLSSGAVVPVTSEEAIDGWWQVKMPDDRRGYVQIGEGLAEIVESPDPNAPSTTDSLVAFQTALGGAIYIIHADGTNLRYLTTGMDPAISPDRQWVAFTRWQEDSYGLFLIKTDGTDEHQLFSQPYMKEPAWSPDGTEIAVSYQAASALEQHLLRNGKWKIAVVTVADGHFREMEGHNICVSPTWSPDAKKIAYASDRGLALTWDDPTNAIVQDPNTYGLSTFPENDRSPAWSPDGKHIAFQYNKDDRSEIYLMNADGSGRVALTKTPLIRGKNVSPVWSVDGSQIAYLSNTTGDWEIMVMNADGSNPHAMFAPGTLNGITFEYKNVDERMISWR